MHTYLSDQALSALQRMSPSLLLTQSRLNHPNHYVSLGRLNCFTRQWLGLAIFSLACPDLAADKKNQISNTYKSQRYTSKLIQHKAQHS
jgi:hypothetical protein